MAIILAIDTSCDDTSVAVSNDWTILSNIVASQNQIHKQFGGVFPTMAKQAHQVNFLPTLNMALQQAKVTWEDIDAIAVTYGPGLAPALEIGIDFAQKLAQQYHKKLLKINHIEGHALSAYARPHSDQPKSASFIPDTWPKLALVISGGHSEFIMINEPGKYEILGRTIDDAAGECLDKVGRMLNLGYPAGPLLEKFAQQGDASRFHFPQPMTDRHDFHLSFSGLKTSARLLIENLERQHQLESQSTYDLAAAIQQAVFDHIIYKFERILYSPDIEHKIYPDRETMKKIFHTALATRKAAISSAQPIQAILLGGGVAANMSLRRALRASLRRFEKQTHQHLPLYVPYTKKLCSDNAAMIAIAAVSHYYRGEFVTPGEIDRQPQLVLE